MRTCCFRATKRRTAFLVGIPLLFCLAQRLWEEWTLLQPIISNHNKNTTASQYMYVHLSRAFDQNVIVVAVNDTRVECWSSSRIFSHNLLLSKDGRIRVKTNHVGHSTQTAAVFVTMNLQRQTICHVERGFWAVDANIDGSESLFRVVSICFGCNDERFGFPIISQILSTETVYDFFIDSRWLLESNLHDGRGNRTNVACPYHTLQVDTTNENNNVQNVVVRIVPSHDYMLVLDPLNKQDFKQSARLLREYYGIGTPSAKELEDKEPLTTVGGTYPMLPRINGSFGDYSEKDESRSIGYDNGANSRGSQSGRLQDGETSPSANLRRNDDVDLCLVPMNECCENKDCVFAQNICVHRNCIDDGFLRITLKWVGNDDLDLFVITPGGGELSFNNFFDPVSLGRFGEDVDQLGSGYHVENIYFPREGAPPGTYTFYVRPLITVEDSDLWTIEVVEDGTTLISHSGYGFSPELLYNRQPRSSPPFPSPPNQATPTIVNPGGPPTQPPLIDKDCSMFSEECCIDTDCSTTNELCVHRTCITEGNPRITLLWEGDDDLNLVVRSPDGVEISSTNTFDDFSGGRYERDEDQTFLGPHIESVYFPLLGSPVGDYRWGVRLISQNGASDHWFVEIYDGKELVHTQAGSGDSPTYSYVRSGGITGPQRPLLEPPRCSPVENECCMDSDCSASQICVQRLCANSGSLRVSLEWIGDDDYDLLLETPAGMEISNAITYDPASEGRFGETSQKDMFDFQLEYIYFPSAGAPLGTYRFSVQSSATRGVGADVWKVKIYEDNLMVQEETGIGDSRLFTYERVFLPTLPTSPPLASPADASAPAISTVFPAHPPSARVCPPEFQCCSTSDCSDLTLICIQRTCIRVGVLTFDLTWTGDDDLSLVVVTPLEDSISRQNPADEVTGGLFQSDSYQPGFGFHVESVVFPSKPPSGNYSFFVRSSITGKEDRWTLKVSNSNQLATFEVGTGNSRTYSYKYKQGLLPSSSPSEPPSASPVSSPSSTFPQIPLPCGAAVSCKSVIEVCVQEVCVPEGNPRMTLQWTGNDDLGLVVVTPDGTSISSGQPFDPVSGGRYGRFNVSEHSGVQEGSGKHQENIYFPLTGGPVGIYQYYVTTINVQGSVDSWTVSVSNKGEEAEVRTGTGVSDVFTYRYMGGLGPPGLQPDSCITSKECMSDQLCVERSCIEDGLPLFVLSYSGDDDLDLHVVTPIGTTVFSQNPDDVPSGGKFGDNGNGNGVQNNPGNHIEYIYFSPDPGPLGVYQYYVETFRSNNNDDPWVLIVYVSGEVVINNTGVGSSDVFVFNFDSTAAPAPLPTVPPFAAEENCDPNINECCTSMDCFPNEACSFDTCVDEGNPRFTLSWEGSNDLDLLVQTPLETVVSFSNTYDPVTGGKFGEEFDQFVSGKHVENIFFPISGGPPGEYSFYVRSFLSDGEDDEYTVQVYVNGLPDFFFTGRGASEKLIYVFQGPVPTIVSGPTGPPISLPPIEPPVQSDCNIGTDECCLDSQCMVGVEVCAQFTCIDIGVLRFTLEWEGDDDLDLTVQTPNGTSISFVNPIDEDTGGVFGEGGAQYIQGNHVENVFFLSQSIPLGAYLYNVSSFESRGSGDDEWFVYVYVNNIQVDIQNGTGDSEIFTYLLNEATGGRSVDPECNPAISECCADLDCASSQVCAQKVCINNGFPRFTLAYTGDDKIDLIVVTPIGSTVSSSFPDDSLSEGRFEDGREDQIFGWRVQNVYFVGALTGVYTYFISTFDLNGQPDKWTVTVFEGDLTIESFTRSGNAAFVYEYGSNSTSGLELTNDPTISLPAVFECETSADECCDDGDCSVGAICRSRTCVFDGSPRFTITWFGSDDYYLAVTAPTGRTLSLIYPFDEESDGRFGGNNVQVTNGLKVENVHFPLKGGPNGVYTAFVSVFDETFNENLPTWTLEVAAEGEVVRKDVGTGPSGPIKFDYKDQINARNAAAANVACPPLEGIGGSCCSSSDCLSSDTLCVSNTCIQEGYIRFTLMWNGDGDLADDLDLVVEAPDGSILRDTSQKRLSQNSSRKSRVESISILEQPKEGEYRYSVVPFITYGNDDSWTVQVFVKGKPASNPQTGKGISKDFIYDFVPCIEMELEGYGKDRQNESSHGTDAFDSGSFRGIGQN